MFSFYITKSWDCSYRFCSDDAHKAVKICLLTHGFLPHPHILLFLYIQYNPISVYISHISSSPLSFVLDFCIFHVSHTICTSHFILLHVITLTLISELQQSVKKANGITNKKETTDNMKLAYQCS